MEMIDFSKYKSSGKFYGGSEKKLGIIIDGSDYMLKFQKKTAFGVRNNHISEYIGSHIFDIAGFKTQETHLGYYLSEPVVACKDFHVEGKQFVPFNDVGESSLDQDKEAYQYEYEDIMQMLRDNSKLTDVEESISTFWDIYIMDALLGNFDRHGLNWGFMKENNKYTMAPIFDNGSCLFPNLTDEEEMRKIIASEEETNKRIYTFPTSQVKLNGKKSSYYEVISSMAFSECNEAVVRMYERVHIEEIAEFIKMVPGISEMQKEFYKHMILTRYEKIIYNSHKLLTKG